MEQLLATGDNQRLEKSVRCVLLLYNWVLRFSFWLATFCRHGHNLVLLKFTIRQLEIVQNPCCLASDRYQHEFQAKCVGQSELAAKA